MATKFTDKYGFSWNKTPQSIQVEFHQIRQGKAFLESKGRSLFHHFRECFKILWLTDDNHRWSDLILKTFCENEISVFMGCSDCVSGDTRILNPITGEQPTIKELCEKRIAPIVATLNGAEQAGVPFVKGVAELFEVKLSDGSCFFSTSGHVVLSDRGFCRVGSLLKGESLFSYEPILRESTSESGPSTRAQDVRCSPKKVGDFQEHCSMDSRQHDEQLLLAKAACQFCVPSQGGAPIHSSQLSGLGGLGHKLKHTRPLSRFFRRAILGLNRPFGFLGNACGFRFSQGTISQPGPLFQPSGQFLSANNLGRPSSKPNHGSARSDLFCNSLHSYSLRVSRNVVVSIRKSHKAKFYDLTVPKAGHYFAEGAIHHNSSKTYTMSKIVLVDYWCFPDKTLWLVSTTEGRGSELRIWGCIKDLFNSALNAGHDLSGHPLDHMKTITSDTIDDDGELARSLRRGIIIVPCKTGGVMSGLAPYIGIKSPRLRHCGDEIPAMTEAFLNAYSNWFGKHDFKGMMSGNFMETDDPLGVAAEPVDGWDSFVDTGKTQSWRSRFYKAMVVALDGRDSPNFDQITDTPKYPYLISQKKLNGVAETKGMDSWEWYSQCVGKPVKGMDIWRVLTKGFCEKNHALEDVIWKGDGLTKIYGLDPAYGQGDRCVGRQIEFGSDVAGVQICRVGAPEIIPIKITGFVEAEEQIAAYVKARLESLGIPHTNCFYDSFGRGTLGFAFAKLMGGDCPIPVDSGARPTNRPVRFDLFVEENGGRRLKRCDEHYTKGISELWFSVREAIESGQIRNLDMDTIKEGQSRKFTKNNQAKIEVEPKDDMKKRLGRSPDLFDCLAVGIEGARQRGFKISRIGSAVEVKRYPDWLDKRNIDLNELRKSRQLEHA